MKHLSKIFIGLSFLFSASAYADCIKESAVTKWEVIKYDKLVAYSGSNYLAFVTFTGNPNLTIGGNVTLRFFSPSICTYDTVVLNGTAISLQSVELIRNK